MEIPLMQASDRELADAVEGNLFALFRSMTILPGSELVEKEGWSYHHAFPTNPMFKGVWNTQLPDDEINAAIDETLEWFRGRDAPYVFWWVGPHTPRDLPERLMAHGFELNVVGDPSMAVDLHALNENIRTLDGFSIVQARDRQALEDWRDVFCASFEIPVFAAQAWVDATVQVGVEHAPWKLYIGYWNSKPVATNMLVLGGGVAGLYAVGTIPEARGKGIGVAITLKPLQDAREQGYRYGALFATEMGYSVYRRVGFHEVGSRIGRYIWWGGA